VFPGKFLHVMLENDGEDQLQRSCENEEVLHKSMEDRNNIHNIKKGRLTGFVTFCVGNGF